MGKLVKTAIVLTLLWCGWWWAGATLIAQGIPRALQEQRAQGWQADVGETSVSGFPFVFDATLTSVAVTDANSALSLQADHFGLSAPAYWPGDLRVTLPDTPITLAVSGAPIFLRFQEAEASLALRPTPALPVKEATLTSGPWQLNTAQGNLLAANTLAVQVTQDTTQAETYDVAFQALAFSPGDLFRKPLNLPTDWPLAFETLKALGSVTFDRPLDRYAREAPPQPRAITLSQLGIAWGDLQISGQAAFSIDALGVPEGEGLLQLVNWRQAIDIAEQSGALPASQRPQIELLLSALANRGDNADTLDLTLTFRAGMMFLSGIPLGPAPRLTFAN